MKTLNINDVQVLILKDLLTEEIDYLENEALPALADDESPVAKKDYANLEKTLNETKEILKQIEE